MIREFFNWRVAILFGVTWIIIALSLAGFFLATKRERSGWFRMAKVPVISGLISLIVVFVIVLLLDVLK